MQPKIKYKNYCDRKISLLSAVLYVFYCTYIHNWPLQPFNLAGLFTFRVFVSNMLSENPRKKY